MRLPISSLSLVPTGAFLVGFDADDGMSTAEYAIGTIAAAAFAAVLYAVVTGNTVVTGLGALVQRALTAGF
jgi:hypothetical protein